MFENIELSPNEYFEKVEELKNDGFEMMVDLTAIDWFRKKEPRFEIVVNFLSVSKNKRVCLVVKVNDNLNTLNDKINRTGSLSRILKIEKRGSTYLRDLLTPKL